MGNQHFGFSDGIVILLHGGAGPQDPSAEGIGKANKSLLSIAKKAYKKLQGGEKTSVVITECIKSLESDHQFNAGIGSALQSDGLARLSASLMDGKKQSFSGVISASYISHPSLLALELQNRTARVISPPGVEILARELNIPISTNITERRSKRWLKSMEKENYPSTYDDCDTVGCIIKDLSGNLFAASSTGGRGHEYPGRVGDTPTVAGNYASKFCSIVATGKGEQITDDGVAVRFETRVRDGMSIEDASRKIYAEAERKKRRYGWLSLDKKGYWSVAHLTKYMPFVVFADNKCVLKFELD